MLASWRRTQRPRARVPVPASFPVPASVPAPASAIPASVAVKDAVTVPASAPVPDSKSVPTSIPVSVPVSVPLAFSTSTSTPISRALPDLASLPLFQYNSGLANGNKMLDVAYDGQDKVTPRVCTDYVVDPADWAPENRGREVSEERGRGAPPGSNTVEAILGTAVAGLRCEVCLQEAADCAGQFCIASFQALIVHNESVCCELRKVGPVEMGFGVFAKCAIPKDTPLSEYTGRLFPLDSRTSGSGTYDFVFAGSACCDASQYGTMSRFVNHHCVNYNLAVKDLMYGRRRVICYTTNRDIAPGEQLFVNYGNTYFNEARRCRCDSQTRPHLVEASFGEAQKDELVELTAKIDTIDHHSQIRPSPVTPWIKPWAEVKKTTKPREELARKAVADGVIDAKVTKRRAKQTQKRGMMRYRPR